MNSRSKELSGGAQGCCKGPEARPNSVCWRNANWQCVGSVGGVRQGEVGGGPDAVGPPLPGTEFMLHSRQNGKP